MNNNYNYQYPQPQQQKEDPFSFLKGDDHEFNDSLKDMEDMYKNMMEPGAKAKQQDEQYKMQKMMKQNGGAGQYVVGFPVQDIPHAQPVYFQQPQHVQQVPQYQAMQVQQVPVYQQAQYPVLQNPCQVQQQPQCTGFNQEYVKPHQQPVLQQTQVQYFQPQQVYVQPQQGIPIMHAQFQTPFQNQF